MIVLLSLCWMGFPPEPIHAKKKKPHQPLAVYDSQTTRVGTVQDQYNKDPSSLWVTITLEGYPIVLQVSRNRLQAPRYVEALYLSLDCSGSPVFQHSQLPQGKTTAPLIFIGPPQETIYVADQSEHSIFLTPQSKKKIGGDCTALPPGPRITVRPSIRLSNLQALYTPPFSIR